jgi:hypothetical protein
MAARTEDDRHDPKTSGPPQDETCPWCPYTGSLEQVVQHMSFEHHGRWCDLALSPPIAGGGPV